MSGVAQVLGQARTPSQVRTIEPRLARSMRAEAAADPQAWLALPLADQLQAAAKRATTDIQAEAVLKVRRGHQQVLAVAKMQKQLDEFPGTPFEALSRAIAFHADARGSQLSMESAARSIERHAMGQLIEALEATAAKFFGLIENPAGVRALGGRLAGTGSGERKGKRLNSSN